MFFEQLSIDPDLSQEEFEYFCEQLYFRAGISLSGMKANLVKSRLRTRLNELNLNSYADYRRYLTSLPEKHEEWQVFINQLTTNKTDWFREYEHFEQLKKDFLPRWMKSGKKHLKVWCTASSTGEEPYSLAMTLYDFFKNTDRTFSIQATDIDTRVLEKAKNGIYPKNNLAIIPDEYHSFFDPGTQEISEWMRVNKKIKSTITFAQFNLNADPFPTKDEFDFIFCRNVLIYFNSQTIEKVVNGLFQSSAPNACLFIAHSESLQNMKTAWIYREPSIYIKGKFFL